MSRFILSILFFLPSLLLAISDEPHHTTAFIAPPRELDVLVSYSSYKTDHFWNKNGKKRKAFNHFHRSAYLLFAEFACNSSNSLTFNGAYDVVKESINGKSFGFEDIEIGWKHLLFEGEANALTLQLIGTIPPNGRVTSICYGKFAFEADLLYSEYFCFWERAAWYDLSIGYRWYQGFPSDQIRASAAIGYLITSWAEVIASCSLDYGLFNGKGKFKLNNITLNPNYRLLNAQLECSVRILPWLSLAAGGFQHLWGENVGAGGGFFVGTWFNF